MKTSLIIASMAIVTLAMPLTAQAQGVPGGASHGFNEGNRIAGPVGAVVGTAVGGVIGGVEGVLGVDRRYYVSDSPATPGKAGWTSRAQIDRLLDPDNGRATIESLRAAKIVGRELRMQLV